MTTDAPADASDHLDADRIATWLAEVLGTASASATISKLDGGHSAGVWRVETSTGDGAASMVLKAPGEPSVVYQRDACREARILDAVGRLGVPVPSVIAIDDGDLAGRRCFVMEHVAGRAVADSSLAAHHDDGWLRDAGTAAQRAIWDSFHDTLAALHQVDPAEVPDALHGPRGVVDVLAYWRAALLDAAPAEAVPRQLRALDWLGASLPPDADEAPSVCMGDARLANCLIAGTEVRALVDFEIAYIGNPAADIAYSIFFDSAARTNAESPLAGFSSADETWARWGRVTGRPTGHRDYWTAFAVGIISVTATRAMIQWGLAGEDVESDNPLVARWEKAVQQAAG
jgi:aminoglycoside phosphotransferase (APT) family kinase protein